MGRLFEELQPNGEQITGPSVPSGGPAAHLGSHLIPPNLNTLPLWVPLFRPTTHTYPGFGALKETKATVQSHNTTQKSLPPTQ